MNTTIEKIEMEKQTCKQNEASQSGTRTTVA